MGYSPHYSPSEGGSGGSGKKSGHAGLITFFVFLVMMGTVGTVVYVKREEVYERFPKVRIAVENIKEKLGKKNRNYDMLHLDAGEADILAPEFVGMQPGPGAYRPPSPRPDPAGDADNDNTLSWMIPLSSSEEDHYLSLVPPQKEFFLFHGP